MLFSIDVINFLLYGVFVFVRVIFCAVRVKNFIVRIAFQAVRVKIFIVRITFWTVHDTI